LLNQRHEAARAVAAQLLPAEQDVDAAIVTLSGLPVHAIGRDLAALSIGGTIIANMLLKMIVAAIYGRSRSGAALVGLAVSTTVLLVTVVGGLMFRLNFA